MTKEANPARKVRTPAFRMSFPNLLTPRKDEDTGRETYGVTMLLPPGADLGPFRAALKAAMVDKYGPEEAKWPKLKRGPKDVIQDFAEYNAAKDKPLPGDWKGWTKISANASVDYPPGVVGPTKGADGKFPKITDQREVYGGRWARATVDAFVYERKDGKGLTFGLKNVQLLKHDASFGGAVTAPEDDFDNASEEWAGEADAFEAGAPAAEKGAARSDWE